MEGLAKAWVHARPALGIFSAEGGGFVGGHAMNEDNQLRSAAALSEMWDGAPISRIRALDGVSMLHGRRLAMHLMVQGEPARRFLSDPMLRDQGFLSRFLVACPPSLAGIRLWREARPEDDAAIRAYGARVLALLERHLPLAEGKQNELEPPSLAITDGARHIWRTFYDHVECQCGPGGDLEPIRGFTAKAAEHAARIAGVLAVVADPDADAICADDMTNAVELADWYVNEGARLEGIGRVKERLAIASRLHAWLLGRGGSVQFRDIVREGPSAVRRKESAGNTLDALLEHRLVRETSWRPLRYEARQDDASWPTAAS